MIDDAVAFGRVDRKHRFHLRQYFMRVHRADVDRRIHEIDRFMRTGRRIRANMGRHDNVAFQTVAFHLHVREFQRRGNGGHRAVGIGYEPDAAWTGTDPAQAAYDAEGRGASAFRFALGAGNDDFNEIRAPFFSRYFLHLDRNFGIAGEQLLYFLSGYMGVVHRFKRGHRLF
jgi:hypothetical protein